MRTVLFFQHAGVMGGSVKSLCGLIQSIKMLGFKSKVCLLSPSQEVIDYYAAYDISAFINKNILPIYHTSGSWFHLTDPFDGILWLQAVVSWRKSVMETIKVVENNPCDLVHLNSSILLPSAYALHQEQYKFVWHIRESPQPRYFGNRLRLFRKCLREFPNERVFIQKSDRRGWMGVEDCGEVIYNSVDDELFLQKVDTNEARRQLGLPVDGKYLLYLGGFKSIKGIFVLLEALRELKNRGQKVNCLMPGTLRVVGQSFRSRVGRFVLKVTIGGTEEMRSLEMIKRMGLTQYVSLMPFQKSLGLIFRAADLVVFPSIVPHNAMPVAEAAASGKPVVASDFEGMREAVKNGVTGLLVNPGDVQELVEGMMTLMDNPNLSRKMGLVAREMAVTLFSQKTEGELFANVYERVLEEGRP